MYMDKNFLKLTLLSVSLALVYGQDAASDSAARLAAVKRVCVHKLAGDESLGAQAQEIIIASLFASKRFVLTENCEKADAVIKGAIIQNRDRVVRAEGEDAGFGQVVALADSTSAGVGAAAGRSGETLISAETVSQTSVIIRIVDKEGEILWAHTEESKAGKVKTSTTVAIDRAVKALVRDFEKLPKTK